MRPNKDRLYVALYGRSGTPKMPGLEDTYHWALELGPKKETPTSRGSKLHAKEVLIVAGDPPTAQWQWRFEEAAITMRAQPMLLARLVVGKVADRARLEAVLRGTPLRPEVDGWNCVAWVREALARAEGAEGVLGVCVLEWAAVRDTAMHYIAEKRAAHRFDGRSGADPARAAVWDLLQRRELVP